MLGPRSLEAAFQQCMQAVLCRPCDHSPCAVLLCLSVCPCVFDTIQVKIMKEWDPTGRNGPRIPLPDVVKVRVRVSHA